jgi:hypothetical protein
MGLVCTSTAGIYTAPCTLQLLAAVYHACPCLGLLRCFPAPAPAPASAPVLALSHQSYCDSVSCGHGQSRPGERCSIGGPRRRSTAATGKKSAMETRLRAVQAMQLHTATRVSVMHQPLESLCLSSRLVSHRITSHRPAASRNICVCIALHCLSKVEPSSGRLVRLLVLAAGELRFAACLCLDRLVMLIFSYSTHATSSPEPQKLALSLLTRRRDSSSCASARLSSCQPSSAHFKVFRC